MTTQENFKSAFIALIGRPNSGKSTLMNTVLGEQISVVTPLPQTTRRNLRGVFTNEYMQLVFVDTPGIHKGRHTFNEIMINEACQAIGKNDADIICYVVDIARTFGEEESRVAELVIKSGIKTFIVFNKIDATKDCEKTISHFFELFPALKDSPSISISASRHNSKDIFLENIKELVPEGPRYYEADELTDANMRTFAAEYIRKHIILSVRDEVPHASFVEIESYHEDSKGHSINATIHVETVGQRGILIGKDGSVIKIIRKKAEMDMQELLQVPVKISLHVKISPKWRDNDSFLRMQGMVSKK